MNRYSAIIYYAAAAAFIVIGIWRLRFAERTRMSRWPGILTIAYAGIAPAILEMREGTSRTLLCYAWMVTGPLLSMFHTNMRRRSIQKGEFRSPPPSTDGKNESSTGTVSAHP